MIKRKKLFCCNTHDAMIKRKKFFFHLVTKIAGHGIFSSNSRDVKKASKMAPTGFCTLRSLRHDQEKKRLFCCYVHYTIIRKKFCFSFCNYVQYTMIKRKKSSFHLVTSFTMPWSREFFFHFSTTFATPWSQEKKLILIDFWLTFFFLTYYIGYTYIVWCIKSLPRLFTYLS